MEITFYRKLANKVADAVVGNQEYSDAEVKRIRYGLVCIFSDLYKFILILLVFSIFSFTKEFLIAFIGTLVLRPVLAGYHAKTELRCIFISFITMWISVLVGGMNILPSYLQIIFMILFPIIGMLIAPVTLKRVESNTGVLKLLAGILTAVLLIIDFYLINTQILLISVIQIYLLTLYQMLRNLH